MLTRTKNYKSHVVLLIVKPCEKQKLKSKDHAHELSNE